MSAPQIEWLGDQALLLRWSDNADIDSNRQVHSLAAKLSAARPPWVIDYVPAYASLAIFFDAAAVAEQDSMAALSQALSSIMATPDAPAEVAPARLIEIPVCYGGDCGQDLEDVARACGLTAAQTVEKHAQCEYVVAMLGFSPGFPYLLGLDPALTVPRLATPRLRVPAGSVGIGGAQTGIYPNEGPGGWRLIGRTPQALFDPRRDPPTRLLPGDRVRFLPIDQARYRKLRERDG